MDRVGVTEKEPLHVAVVGSRKWPDLTLLNSRVAAWMVKLHEKHPHAVIVSGGAPGVDRAAESAALLLGHTVHSYRPLKTQGGFTVVLLVRQRGLTDATTTFDVLFSTYGQAAYYRNRLIVMDAQQVVAFTTGSSGTANTLAIAAGLGVPTHIALDTSATI